MARILLIGGEGFIGQHVFRELDGPGNEVRTYDFQWERPTYHNPYLQRALSDFAPEVIVNLAAEMGFTNDFSRYMDTLKTEAFIWEHFSKMDHRDYPERYILISSQAVYGGPGRRWKDMARGKWEQQFWNYAEDQPATPTTIYGKSKLMQEDLAKFLAKEKRIKFCALRLSIVVGPGQRWGSPYMGVVRNFSRALLQEQSPVFFEDGEQMRDFVHVTDVARAVRRAAKGSAPPGTYNIGGGKPISVRAIWEHMAASQESNLQPLIPGVWRYGDVRHAVSDITNAKHYLGWEPNFDGRIGATAYLEGLKKDPEAGRGGPHDQIAELVRMVKDGDLLATQEFEREHDVVSRH